MKKAMKKCMAAAASAVLFMSATVPAFASADTLTAGPLRFGEDGTLRVMHVTDTHLSEDNLEDSVWLIGQACDREKPDIVLLTGDIAMADTVEETFRKTDALMDVFEQRDIPVAVTFGNHDSESGVISREELMAHYNTFDCSVSLDDGELLPGCGTYHIPVLGSKEDKVKFNLWVFDSGDYDSEHHYANVLEEQVEWYKKVSEALEQETGGKVYSLAFQHIIVPEVYEALKKGPAGAFSYEHMYDESVHYRFDGSVTNYGMLHETPCCGYYNHGQFDAMAERGDVLAIFTGHDHTNAFGVRYKDIDIVNSLSTRYNGDAFSSQYGYRMIEVSEDTPDTYTTKVVHWYDFFGCRDMEALKGDSHRALAAKIRFLGFFQKLFTDIGVFFTETFTGRTVRYPD